MQKASPAHEGITPPRRMSALDNAKGLSLDFVFINLNQHSITDLHCFGRMSAFFFVEFPVNMCRIFFNLSLVKLYVIFVSKIVQDKGTNKT